MFDIEKFEEGNYISSKVDFWSLELQQFPVNMMGLVPDEIRESEKFQMVNLEYKKWFSKLREFNASLSKTEKRMFAKRNRMW